MNGYECQEPGCNFNIYAAGPILTEEDMEKQDYFVDEIRDHEEWHEREKEKERSERALRIAKLEQHFQGLRVHAVHHRGRIALQNPTPGAHYLVNDDASGRCEFLFELGYQGVVDVIYKVVIVETNVRVFVQPEGGSAHAVFAAIGAETFDLQAERFIVPESFEHNVFKGCQGVVLHIDGRNFVPKRVGKLTHEISPSVGAPSGAGVGTSDHTGGEEAAPWARYPGRQVSKQKEMPPAVRAAEGVEKPNN